MDGIKVKRVIMRRLEPGRDLLAELNRIVKDENVTLGALGGIGELKRATVGIFNLERREYETRTFDEEMEICALTGNVSLKEGAPFVHAHLALSDRRCQSFGGHMMPGCEVFVTEVVIWELEGATLVREPREECGGLALWAIQNVGKE